MNAPDPAVRRSGEELERHRLRTTRRVVLAGPVLGVVGAITIAAIGGSGAAGLAVLLLACAVGAALGAIVTMVGALVDERRDQPAGRRRLLVALACFLAAPILVSMSLGAAGG